MCQNNLLIERKTNQPIEIKPVAHSFVYRTPEQVFTLLDDIEMMGVINYAACYAVNNEYGVKSGYMFIVGDKET